MSMFSPVIRCRSSSSFAGVCESIAWVSASICSGVLVGSRMMITSFWSSPCGSSFHCSIGFPKVL